MGVNLGGRDGVVAEELLDVTDVDASPEEVRGCGVTQHVGGKDKGGKVSDLLFRAKP